MNFSSQFTEYNLLDIGFIKIPKYVITQEEKTKYNITEELSSKEFLFEIVNFFFDKKLESGNIPKQKEKEYSARLKTEYKALVDLQFVDYILLIYDIIQFCRKNNILNSPSRGSCGGSLILYVLGVIDIDPIKHDLLFERFISASRTEIKEVNGDIYIASSSLPDVDIDSDRIHKHRINEYLETRFPRKTCKILNLTTLTSKMLIKECGKVVSGKSEDEMKQISSKIENIFGKNESLPKTYENSADFRLWCNRNKRVYDIALKLQNLIKNKSVHASGILVCNNELDESLPTEITKDKEIVSSFSMEHAQMVGIKVDNLGLKNLGTIDRCLKSVNKQLKDIDVNDESIYKYLCASNNYHGIFQCEEGLGKEVLLKIQPQSILDLSVSIALGRPGCMKFVDDYTFNKNNGFSVDERLKDILDKTYGIIIFQEQIMKLCSKMAKFDPKKSDGVRKAIGKKLVDKMKEYKDEFIKGSIDNGFDKDFVEQTWQTFEDSGNYLFNASHACGYAHLTAITAYLKANHPKEYFKELLISSKDEQDPTDEITKISQELPFFGIKLLPPHILKSSLDFSIEGDNIRFGLLSIKGISEKSVEKLTKFKNELQKKFQIFNSIDEAKLPLSISAPLIQAGALDGFPQTRTYVVLEVQLWSILTKKEKETCLLLADRYDNDLIKTFKALSEKMDEKGKPYVKPSRLETIRKKYKKFQEIYKQNSQSESFANWYYEKKLLGYTPSIQLRDIFLRHEPDLELLKDVVALDTNEKICFVAYVKDAVSAVSKKKTKYYKIEAADGTAGVNIFLFDTSQGQKIEKCKLNNNGKLPKENNIIIVYGTKKDDAIFAEDIIIKDDKIYTKLGDLKDNDE